MGMDPATVALLLGGVVKVSDTLATWYKTLREDRGTSIARTATGMSYELASQGRMDASAIPYFGAYNRGDPVPFVVQFAAADDWAQEYLLADQPVVVVIEDCAQDWEVDALIAVAALGDQVEGALYPGVYRLSAMVFLDDDPDNWDEEDLDGGALVEFSVTPGEAPFALEVRIEAAGLPQVLLQDEGYLNAGGVAEYQVDLSAGVTYQIYAEPIGTTADLDLAVLDESGQVVALDGDLDSDALCQITPAWDGPFTLLVTNESLGTRYRLQVLV
jgi:hypothetical protein